MRALFVIFALAIGSASADPLLVYPGGTGSPGQVFAPVVLRAALATGGPCAASVAGSFGEPITVTRATSATIVSGGIVNTCTSGQARVDSTNGLLIEPARTNIYLNSEQVSSWGRHLQSTTTTDADVAPDGNSTADRIVEDATASATHMADSSIAVTAGNPHAVSVFVKAGTRTWARVYKAGGFDVGCYINLSTGALGTCNTSAGGTTGRVDAMGNGWYRVCLQVSGADVNSTPAFFGVQLATGDLGNTYSGDNASYARVWGEQVEANQTYCSNYIATAGTSVARNADAVSSASVTRGGGDASFSFDVCFEGANTAYSSIFPTQIDVEGISNQVFRVAWDNSANWNCIARGTGDAGQVVVATLADSWSAGACRHVIGSWDVSQKKLTCTVKNGGTTIGSETTPATTNAITDIATLYFGKDNNNAGRETGGNIANECFSVAQSANGGCQ